MKMRPDDPSEKVKGLTPEECNRIYQEEKVRHEAQLQIQADEKAKKKTSNLVGLILLGLGIAVGLFVFLGSELKTMTGYKPARYVRVDSLSDYYTLSDYNQLESGMPLWRVKYILTRDGTEVARNELAGIVTVAYSYKNENGSNMQLTFQDDKLVSKAQFGLK
jgi:hypothetical protein